jgi:hypothetical protein
MSTMGSSAAQEEARAIAAAQAAGVERRNRPLHLPIAAGVLLAVAMIAMLISWNGYSKARRSLDFQRSRADTIAMQVARLKSLQDTAANSEGVASLNEPMTQLLPRITSAGAAVGLKDPVRLPTNRTDAPTREGARMRRLEYDVADESLANLLAWVERSLAEVPGLEVYRVVLRPEPQRWRLRITFSRWEKAE